MKRFGSGTYGQVTGVVTGWLGADPLFAVESSDRSTGLLVKHPPAEGGPKLFDPGDVVSLTGTLTDSSGMLIFVPDRMPVKLEHRAPLLPLASPLRNLVNHGLGMDGLLVRVWGRTISRNDQSNPFFEIDDGSDTGPVKVYTRGKVALPEVSRFVVLDGISCRRSGIPYMELWYPEDMLMNIPLP